MIGYVTGLSTGDIYELGTAPILMGSVSGWWTSALYGEGEMESATFGISPALRAFFVQNVYNVPEAPYTLWAGPSVSDMAIYGTDNGIEIDDRAVIYNNTGGGGVVGSNPIGWLTCPGYPNAYYTPTTLVPSAQQYHWGTSFGTDVSLQTVWANDTLSFHDRDQVSGQAFAEGDILVTTQASVTYPYPHMRIVMPSLNVTGTAMPTGAQCSSMSLEPSQTGTAPTPANCAYIPSVTVKSNANLTFPCSAVPYHVGNLDTEPNGSLVFSMAGGCANATVYVHGSLTLKGTMSSGIDPVASSVSNVLFVTTSTWAEIEAGFNGVLMAPNGFIHAVPGQKHYGAFYGKRVYLEQDSKFYHRPFNAALPLQ